MFDNSFISFCKKKVKFDTIIIIVENNIMMERILCYWEREERILYYQLAETIIDKYKGFENDGFTC